MGFNQTIREVQSRFEEAQRAATALAEGLQAAADAQPERRDSAPPRSRHEVCQVAAGVNCSQCWQRAGCPCTISGAPGYHLARLAQARRRGLITEPEMAAVLAMAGDHDHTTIVRDRPGGAR